MKDPEPIFYPIDDLVKWKDHNFLVPNREYQRGERWRTYQKQLFIDSIFRGYPVPAFYIHKQRKTLGSLDRDTLFIVDGQQRINAIHGFVNGDFSLLDPSDDNEFRFPNLVGDEECPWAGKKFCDLDPDLQARFRALKVVVYEITTDNENTVRDLFIRLQGGVPLSAQEKRDSWPGKFTDFILEAGGKTGNDEWPGYEGWPFFQNAVRGNESQRRQQVAICYMLFHANRHGQQLVDAKSRSLDEFYHKHIAFDDASDDAVRFRNICDKLADIFKGGERLLGHHIIHLIMFLDETMDKAVKSDLRAIPKALLEFEKRCRLAKTAFEEGGKSKYADYHRHYGAATRSGSNNAPTIRKRHGFFLEKMKELTGIKFKDADRIFSDFDKKSAYYRDDLHCQVCKMKGNDLEILPFDKADFHHVEGHAQGGATEIRNCATVHRDCHPKSQSEVKKFAEWWSAMHQQQNQVEHQDQYDLPPHGTKLRSAPKSHKSTGVVYGQLIRLDGHDEEYTSLSAAAAVASKYKHGPSGWDYWDIQLPDEDEWVRASVWRDQE